MTTGLQQSTNRFKSFVIAGESFVIDTNIFPSFRVPGGPLFSTGVGKWIYRPSSGTKDTVGAHFIDEDDAIKLLHLGGAYNSPRFGDLPQEIQDRVTSMLGQML